MICPMPKPSWSKDLSFVVDIERGMPARILVSWEAAIRFLDTTLKDQSLELYHVYVHWHADPDLQHYCGVTYLDDKRMAFCSGNDRETMLHEIAHLKYGSTEHDDKWAAILFALHKKYLKGKEREKADAELAKDYKSGARVLKRQQRPKTLVKRTRSSQR